MKSKIVILAFSILIFISLCGNIIFYQKLQDKPDYGDIMGSYIYGDVSMPTNDNTFYFVANSDEGTFSIYKQFDILERGSYTHLYENVYALGESEKRLIVCSDRVYLIDDEIYLMTKFSPTPVYINVFPTEENQKLAKQYQSDREKIIEQEKEVQEKIDDIYNEINSIPK